MYVGLDDAIIEILKIKMASMLDLFGQKQNRNFDIIRSYVSYRP